MRTQHRPRGRAPAALLSLCLGLASACSDEPQPPVTPPDAAPPPLEIPLGASLPPLAYTLALTYAGADGLFPRPETITGHLYLDVDAEGQVTGAISALESGSLGLAMISGRVVNDEMVFVSVEVDPGPNSSLELQELRISLFDRDADGAADSAEGQAYGFWFRGELARFDYLMHTAVLTAGLDGTAPTASLDVPGDELMPYDAIRVLFSEPLREADVRDELRILAGGAPVAGELTLATAAGLAIGATLQPDAFLPFGAEVTIELGDLADPSGQTLTVTRERASVRADPGQVTGNTGFEAGLAGWLHSGEVRLDGTVEGFAPVEGVAQAVIPPGSTLAAAIDVPADATGLELSFVLLSDQDVISSFVEGKAEITLRTAGGERIEIVDATSVADFLAPCAMCTEYGFFVGPYQYGTGITPGQRVFLVVELRASSEVAPNGFTLLLDGIQIH